jgi:hypothetical protein
MRAAAARVAPDLLYDPVFCVGRQGPLVPSRNACDRVGLRRAEPGESGFNFLVSQAGAAYAQLEKKLSGEAGARDPNLSGPNAAPLLQRSIFSFGRPTTSIYCRVLRRYYRIVPPPARFLLTVQLLIFAPDPTNAIAEPSRVADA